MLAAAAAVLSVTIFYYYYDVCACVIVEADSFFQLQLHVRVQWKEMSFCFRFFNLPPFFERFARFPHSFVFSPLLFTVNENAFGIPMKARAESNMVVYKYKKTEK